MTSTPAAIDTSTHPFPFHLLTWIDSHKASLQPPVNNAMIYGRGAQFKLMVIGGPNLRTDYHINQGEEWSDRSDWTTLHRYDDSLPLPTHPAHSFSSAPPPHVCCGCVRFHQLKGDMVLKVVDGGRMKDVVIREGDVFLLPPNVPHSPQRLAGTLGLVMERERDEPELDGLRWYCAHCQAVVYEEYFRCIDLGKQIKEKIGDYFASTERRTCKACGTVDQVPAIDRDKVKTVEDIIAATRSGGSTLPDKEQPGEAASHPVTIDRASFHSVIVPSSTTTSVPPLTPIDPSTHPVPFSLRQYIAQNAASLRPPVCNKLLYGGLSCEYQIQIVGGPNNRTDYHLEDGEEWSAHTAAHTLLPILSVKQRATHLRPLFGSRCAVWTWTGSTSSRAICC